MKSESAYKEREILGIRPFVWIVMLGVFFAWLIATSYSGLWFIILTGGMDWNHNWMHIAVFSILLLAMLNYLLPKNYKLRPQELAIMYMVLAISGGYMGQWYYGSTILATGIGARAEGPILDLLGWEKSLELVPSYFAPVDKNAIEMMLYGGKPVPWNAWLPFLTYYISFYTLFFLMMVFFSMILRRQWVEIETLGFPYVVPVTSLIDVTTDSRGVTESDEKRRRMKLIFIAAAVGFAIHMLDFFHILIPEFPGLPWWSNYWIKWGLDLVPIFPAFAEATPGSAWMVTFGPSYIIALWTLIPTEVLFSASVIFALFYWILPPFLVGAGLAPYDPKWTGYSRWVQIGWGGLVRPTIFGNYAFFWIGIIAVVLQYKNLWGTFKSLWTKPDIGDEGEPMPYRFMWIGFILSFILLVALTVVAGSPIGPAITVIFALLLFSLGGMRLKAESGIFGHGFIGGHDQAAYFAAWGPYPTDMGFSDVSRELWVPYYTAFRTWNNWGVFNTNKGAIAMENWKLASDTKTNLRDSFIGMVFFGVLAIVVSLLFGLYLTYQYGATKTTGLAYWRMGRRGGVKLEPKSVAGAGLPWVEIISSGILTLLLMLARMRWPAFPLSPIGFVLGGSYYTVDGKGTMFMIAWLIKILVLKIGGTTLYERKWVPLVIGFFFGSAAVYVLMAWIAVPLTGGGWFAWGPP